MLIFVSNLIILTNETLLKIKIKSNSKGKHISQLTLSGEHISNQFQIGCSDNNLDNNLCLYQSSDDVSMCVRKKEFKYNVSLLKHWQKWMRPWLCVHTDDKAIWSISGFVCLCVFVCVCGIHFLHWQKDKETWHIDPETSTRTHAPSLF